MAFPKIEGYVVTEKLGSGSYSTVYKAYTKVGTRSVVAVKCVDKSRVRHSSAAVDSLVMEIRLLKKLAHPHIVTMINFTWDDSEDTSVSGEEKKDNTVSTSCRPLIALQSYRKVLSTVKLPATFKIRTQNYAKNWHLLDRNIFIIMEFCNGGDLSRYIKRYGRVPESQVLYFLQQLASALQFLRQKGVAHMDLKPHNLLLHKDGDGKYTLKVADFGLAQHLVAESAGVRGSPLYMAPEVLLDAKYDARADLWSVGVILYECLFGRAPYSSTTIQELIDKIMRKTPIELPPGSGVSPGCRDLLSRLLTHDPDARITHDEFFHHEYLDLEHMPSKENYEKAVSLISLAISQESSGELRQALSSYTSALRYLVPAVRAEPRAPRRHALRAKLERYMERAEEIKQYLNDPDSVTQSSTAMSSTVMTSGGKRSVTCCSNSAVVSSGHCYELAKKDTIKTSDQPIPNQSCHCPTSQNEDKNKTISISNDAVKYSIHDHDTTNQDVRNTCQADQTSKNDKNTDDRCQIDHNTKNVKNRQGVKDDKTRDTVKETCRDSSKESGGFKKSFRLFLRTTVPQLNAQDSSIVAAEEASEQKTSDETNDGCRIT